MTGLRDEETLLADDRASVAAMEEEFSRRLRRSLTLWAIRWAIGLGLAFAITFSTGNYGWLPWAAGCVALVSLGVILFMDVMLRRRFAATRLAMDSAERVAVDQAEDKP